MTLGENKKITLGLIEEYSPNNSYLTDDEDISTRLNLVYSISYQKLSQIKKILKTKVLRDIIEDTEDGYEEYSLPSNLYQLRRVIALDENNNMVTPDYYTLGKKIYVSKKTTPKYILEYYIFPSVITEETDDDFTLEIEQDAQFLLPYAVAKDILKADPSSDYTAFEATYRRELESFDNSRMGSSVIVEEGEL